MSRSESRASMASGSSRLRPSAASSSNTGTSTTATKSPLESLIYSVVPALAPPSSSRYRSSKDHAGSVPGSRSASRQGNEEAERARRAKVRELAKYCEDIMRSSVTLGKHFRGYADRYGSRSDNDGPVSLASLPDAARRLLAESRASSRQTSGSQRPGESAAEAALRFSGSWRKLEKGVSPLLRS